MIAAIRPQYVRSPEPTLDSKPSKWWQFWKRRRLRGSSDL